MEAGKFHNLLSARWRTRNAGAIIQSESEGLRTKGTKGWCDYHSESKGLKGGVGGVSPRIQKPENQEIRCPRAGEDDVPGEEEREFTLPLPFCSIQGLSGLEDAHSHW